MFFDHRGLGLKHRDHPHYFLNDVHVSTCLTSLKNFNCCRLDDHLTVSVSFRGGVLLGIGRLSSLLLIVLDGDDIDSDVGVIELGVEGDELVGVVERWFLNLLVQDSHLRVAEEDDGGLQELFRNVRSVFDLLDGQ